MRVFVAIDLPRDVREALGSLATSLREDVRGIRWVRLEGIHLTLRFIGEVGQQQVEPLGRSLGGTIPGSIEPFDLAIHGLGTFPERGRPRVLWVAVDDAGGRLVDLQGRVEAAVLAAGLPGEQRPFHPHLTLGRFGEGRPPAGHVSALERHRGSQHGGFRVTAVTLFQSILKPGGAEYRVVGDYPLVGVRPGGAGSG